MQSKKRLAIIVSHPIQYYAPLYRRLAQRDDLAIKVFFTWHAGRAAVQDHGFKKQVAWDIPLTEGYEFESVPNTSSDPGTHRFFGLRNPSLIRRAMAWRPDAVHVTGWAWFSHMLALRDFSRLGIPTIFRGDSHLLDSPRRGPRWWIKRAVLARVFSWPSAFLYVGQANRAYYEAFGVPASRLHYCPHSIEVARFAEPADELERQARVWREELAIPQPSTVLLFAGKFEPKKRPVALMEAVRQPSLPGIVLVMVGDGEMGEEVRRIAAQEPARFRVLPFQNQSRMPAVYRLGDLFVLPSAYGETWGLAVNEALACGRPVLVSSRVGCAADVVNASCGTVFAVDDWRDFARALDALVREPANLRAMRSAAARRAREFDIRVTEDATVGCLERVLGRRNSKGTA